MYKLVDFTYPFLQNPWTIRLHVNPSTSFALTNVQLIIYITPKWMVLTSATLPQLSNYFPLNVLLNKL